MERKERRAEKGLREKVQVHHILLGVCGFTTGGAGGGGPRTEGRW